MYFVTLHKNPQSSWTRRKFPTYVLWSISIYCEYLLWLNNYDIQFRSWYTGPFLWNRASNRSQRDHYKTRVKRALFVILSIIHPFVRYAIFQNFAEISCTDQKREFSSAEVSSTGRIRRETTCTTCWNFLHERELSPGERERGRIFSFATENTEIFLSPRMDQTKRKLPDSWDIELLARGVLDLVGLTGEVEEEAVSGNDTTKMRRTKCQGAWLAMCMQGWHAISRYSTVLASIEIPRRVRRCS